MDFELTTELSRQGFDNARVLAAMMRVDRQSFVPSPQQPLAHQDRAIPIGFDQTVSQPFVVAHILAALDEKPGAKVFEVGVGSGWLAALLAELGYDVFGIERVEALAEAAAVRLASLEYRVRLKAGDGMLGWPEEAPFDVIIVSAATETVPPALLNQLVDCGQLIAPIGPSGGQLLTILRKRGTETEKRVLFPVVFVPLLEGVRR